MTIRGYMISLFPIFHAISIAIAMYFLFAEPSALAIIVLLFVIYLFPVILFRLHNLASPLKKGFYRLSAADKEKQKAHYSSWWGSHQLQVLFTAVPFFESVLRIIPGAYSAWLRLWGSQIGKGVYWTPLVEITDRSLLKIGDHVIFGHRSSCFSHVIFKKKVTRKGCDKSALTLYICEIEIGNHVFIGAGTCIGPGVKIQDNVNLPALTIITPNKTVDRISKTK